MTNADCFCIIAFKYYKESEDNNRREELLEKVLHLMMYFLVPAYSSNSNQVDLSTYLTKKIHLNIPMMSAGMDTVSRASYGNCYGSSGESVSF